MFGKLAIQLLMSIGIVKNNKKIVAQAFDLIAHKPKTSQLDYLTMVYGLVYLGQYSLAVFCKNKFPNYAKYFYNHPIGKNLNRLSFSFNQ